MYEYILTYIGELCGIAAREIVRSQYASVGHARAALLRQHVDTETRIIRKAYLLIEILFSASFVRTLWPHKTVDERDLRNKFRSVCPNLSHAVARGWGYNCTFNPMLNNDNTLPILVHGFSLNKQVDTTDSAWGSYRIGAGENHTKMIVRPALRSLANPLQVVNLVLSTSLISNAKCSTASPVGFILNAPALNVYGLAPKDIQFANDKAINMTAVDQARGIASAKNNYALTQAHEEFPMLATLIAGTTGRGGESGYNEIIILGTSKLYLTKVQVTGIFVKVAQSENGLCLVDAATPIGDMDYDQQVCFYHDDRIINAIKECCNKYDLPIVPVTDQSMADRVTGRNFKETFSGLTIREWNCKLT